MDIKDKDESHPGWAVKFGPGDWLGSAHGWCSVPPVFATIFESEEQAKNIINKDDLGPCKIVVAWEVVIAKLRYENQRLSEANHVDPRKLFHLSCALHDLKLDIESLELEFKKLSE